MDAIWQVRAETSVLLQFEGRTRCASSPPLPPRLARILWPSLVRSQSSCPKSPGSDTPAGPGSRHLSMVKTAGLSDLVP